MSEPSTSAMARDRRQADASSVGSRHDRPRAPSVYGRYIQAKADWLAAHPDATAEEIEQAARLLAESLEL